MIKFYFFTKLIALRCASFFSDNHVLVFQAFLDTIMLSEQNAKKGS